MPQELETLVWILGVTVGLILLALLVYQQRARLPKFYAYLGYFSLLGMGFMLVELGLIQQIRLVIGHPTLSVTLVIGSLLIGGGVGSAVFQPCVAKC